MVRLLSILVILLPTALQADVVLLRDGSILKGQITALAAKKLTIVNFYGTFNIDREDFHKAYRTESEKQDDKVKARIDSFRAKGDLIQITSAVPDPVVVALERDGHKVEEVRDFAKAAPRPKPKPARKLGLEAGLAGLMVSPLNIDLPTAPGVALWGSLPVASLLGQPLRAGLAVSFSQHASKTDSFDGSIRFMPILAYAEWGWPLGRFVPYARLGLGAAYVSFDRQFFDATSFASEPQESGGSLDGSIMAALGVRYQLRRLRHLAPFLQIKWLTVFEENQSHFAHLSLGVGYRPAGFAAK